MITEDIINSIENWAMENVESGKLSIPTEEEFNSCFSDLSYTDFCEEYKKWIDISLKKIEIKKQLEKELEDVKNKYNKILKETFGDDWNIGKLASF